WHGEVDLEVVPRWHASTYIFSEWSGLGLTICACITIFMIVDLSRDIFTQRTMFFG
ncbi:unnamed protein product, partial [Sphagnum compactum]